MKKELLRLVLTTCFAVMALFASADTVGGLCGIEGDKMVSWELNRDIGLLTISGYGAMADFDDASEAPWYSYSKSIVHLIVEEGVTHISQAGFLHMPYLESAEIAGSVESIGDYAFYGSPLALVIPNGWVGDIDVNLLPTGLRSIGSFAFSETLLENITLPYTLETIGGAAFAYNEQLEEVTSLATVPPVSGRAVFFDCNKLFAIHVPDGEAEAYKSADGWATYANMIFPASQQVDNPNMGELSTYGMPYNTYVTDLGKTSALVVCSLPDGATGWNMHYRQVAVGDEQEMRWVALGNLTTRSYTIEDLKPGTPYEVRMQAVFGNDAVSEWTRSLPFTTVSEDAEERENKQEQAFVEYKEVKKAECDDMAMPEIDDKHCALLIEQAKQAIDALAFDKDKTFDENLAALDAITSQLAIDLSLHRAEMGDVRATGVTIDETTFPDENFRKWLLKQSYGKDGILTEEEIAEVKSIDVAYQDIKSLKGIEYFTALETLFCDCNPLTGLDVSQNTTLTYLHCAQCSLTSLDVTKNTALRWFSCPNNKLTSLDVTKNPALEYLYCIDNQLTTLDLTKNEALVNLSCYSNPITTLDVTKNTALNDFSCGGCKLTSLDVTKNTELKYFSCYGNQLSTLDISNNTNLVWIYCNDNQLTSIDVSKHDKMTGLFCYNNQLTALDVTNCTALESLSCNKNQLTTLDLTKNAALQKLECSVNQLSELDITHNPELNWVVCGKNQLSTLDVSKNSKLTDLYCNDNKLTSLDLSQNPVLNVLDFHVNMIKGEAMDALIESLPNITEGFGGTLRVIFNEGEQNVITTTQVEAAKAKGWTPMYFENYWKPYAGSDPSGIKEIEKVHCSMFNGQWFDLQGRKVTAPTRKGIYIQNGKKVMK
jgi:hypothetical protein